MRGLSLTAALFAHCLQVRAFKRSDIVETSYDIEHEFPSNRLIRDKVVRDHLGLTKLGQNLQR